MKFSVDPKTKPLVKGRQTPALFEAFSWEDKKSLSFQLKQIIFQACQEALWEKIELRPSDIKLEHPTKENYGDYASNIAMILAGKMKKQKGNFLENIDWMTKNINENNFKDFKKPLSIGRLSGEIKEAIGAKNDLVYLKPKVYAKIKGWIPGHLGHEEITLGHFYLLPLFLYAPTKLFKDRRNKHIFHFVSQLSKSLDVVVDLLYWGEDFAQVSTVFFTRESYLKNFRKIKIKAVLGGRSAVPPSLSDPKTFGFGAGSRFSSLHQNQEFYNKIKELCQEDILSYEIKLSPEKIAQEIADYLNKSIKQPQRKSFMTSYKTYKSYLFYPSDILEKVEVAGAGFLNLWLHKEFLISQMQELPKREDNLRLTLLKDKRLMVEFAHPNTHKEFHIGHLRNITIGESIVRILEATEAKVVRANYQGDVGMHIAKAIYALMYLPEYQNKTSQLIGIEERIEFLGKAYAAGSKAYEEDEKAKAVIKDINYLVYASAQKFQQEQGVDTGSTDYPKFVEGRKEEVEKVYALWKMTRQWSLDYFEKIYQRVYTKYDRYYFESECLKGVDLAKEAVERRILKESEGAIIFEGKPYGLDNRVFVNSLGLPTYEAKELSLAQKEFSEFGTLDKVIHVVGPEQTSFFKVTFKVEELLDPTKYKDRQYHLVYGWVRLKKGKMSSRLGNVILGRWLLDEAKKRIQKIVKTSVKKARGYPRSEQMSSPGAEEGEEIAEKVGVAAVKYSMLRVNPKLDIAFDLDESVSFEGDSGPYLLYTYARCRSVLRKSGLVGFSHKLPKLLKSLKKINEEELSLLRTFYRFPEVVVEAAQILSPNLICSFLFDLAQKYNLFYNKHSILNPESNKDTSGVAGKREARAMTPPMVEEAVKTFRLSLTATTAAIIRQGLHLLGIETVERM